MGDLITRAAALGAEHHAQGIEPFGDCNHVEWEGGSTDLMAALGVTDETSEDNYAERYGAVSAYCDALEGEA